MRQDAYTGPRRIRLMTASDRRVAQDLGLGEHRFAYCGDNHWRERYFVSEDEHKQVIAEVDRRAQERPAVKREKDRKANRKHHQKIQAQRAEWRRQYGNVDRLEAKIAADVELRMARGEPRDVAESRARETYRPTGRPAREWLAPRMSRTEELAMRDELATRRAE